jgi:hypothetical protein
LSTIDDVGVHEVVEHAADRVWISTFAADRLRARADRTALRYRLNRLASGLPALDITAGGGWRNYRLGGN